MGKPIGMPEAAQRMNVSRTSALRALKDAGVPLIEVNRRAFAVDEADLAVFLDARQTVGYVGRGRPRKRTPEGDGVQGDREAEDEGDQK